MYLSKFSSSIKKAEENSTINLSSLSQNINSALKKICQERKVKRWKI